MNPGLTLEPFNFKVPQPVANNRAVSWNRGKTIGGSTAINFMAYGVKLSASRFHRVVTYLFFQRPASGEIDGKAFWGGFGRGVDPSIHSGGGIGQPWMVMV